MSKAVIVEPICYNVVRIVRPETKEDFKFVRLELKQGNIVTVAKASKVMNKDKDMIAGLDLPKVKFKWEINEPDKHEDMPIGVQVVEIRGVAFEVMR